MGTCRPEPDTMTLDPNRFRPWATPLVIGSSLLLGVTGILMFFHLDSGLNKVAHEWLSWIFLAAVGLHVLLNRFGFKRHFQARSGRWVILACAIVLALSFLPLGKTASRPSFAGPVQALAQAPLPVVAQVAGISVPEATRRLGRAGVAVTGDASSIRDLVGADLKAQLRALNAITTP